MQFLVSQGNVSGKVTHYSVVLFDTFFIRDDFHIPDCNAETADESIELYEFKNKLIVIVIIGVIQVKQMNLNWNK